MQRLCFAGVLALALSLAGCINHVACTAGIAVSGVSDREADLKRINDELVKMKFYLKKPPVGADQWLMYSQEVFEKAPEFTLGMLSADATHPDIIVVSFGVSADKFSKDGVMVYHEIADRLAATFGAARVKADATTTCGQGL